MQPTHTLLALWIGLLAVPAAAQSRFAVQVVAQTSGIGGGGIANPLNALGAPQGSGLQQGSLHVHSLGIGGSLTLELGVDAIDGPGADLAVYENGFMYGAEVFSEAFFVEVSSNGIDFARFPSRYYGPSTGFAGALAAPWGTYSGMGGCVPVLANATTNSISPFNPVVAGGEAFDLADLNGHPLHTQGLLDLQAVRRVRLVDAVEGVSVDAYGQLVWDNSGAFSSADVDAVAVIQTHSTVSSTQPSVDLYLDPLGHLVLELTDPDGFADIVQSQCKASYNLVPITLTRLRGLMPSVSSIPNGLRMRSLTPVQGSGRRAMLSVSAVDTTGGFSVDQIALQG